MKFATVALFIALSFFNSGCSDNSSTSQYNKTRVATPSKYPRCAGSFEPEKCERDEEKLASETPEQKRARQERLDADVRASSEIVSQTPVSDDRSGEREWFAHNINHSNCISSQSPAQRMRDLQSWGKIPRVTDLTSGAVEVEADIGYGRTEVWTYYRSMPACVASLPKSMHIDRKYE